MRKTFCLDKDREEVINFQSVPFVSELEKANPTWDRDGIEDYINTKKAAYSMNDNWPPVS